MNSADIQQLFFTTLKNAIPANKSLADEIADVLDIGYDSVYRRIRGEKPLSIGELKTLCDHFHISLDQVLQLRNESIVFLAPGINNNNIDFAKYLSNILSEFKFFNSFHDVEMFYLCKDLPIWHFFILPEIAAFKIFCWIKTIQNHPDYLHKVFSLSEFPFKEHYRMGQQILSEFNKISSTELWNNETIASTINQIQYYRDARLFATRADFEAVLNSLKKMIDHLMDQAEAGVKYLAGTSPDTARTPCKLYVNEVLLGNNTTLVSLDKNLHCYINYNGLSYFKTSDTRFTGLTMSHFNTLKSRATLISGTGEKFRNKYFNGLQERITSLTFDAAY